MIVPIIAQANAAFPNLAIDLADQRQRLIVSRRIGRYGTTLLRTPAASVELSGQKAAGVGLGGHFKLIWQLGGQMRYHGRSRSFDILPGDLLVTAMGEDYRLDMFDTHEALVTIFDPADDPAWLDLAGDALARPIRGRSGSTAAAAGMRTLLGAPTDPTGEAAAHGMIGLALASTRKRDGACPRSPVIGRATLHVLRRLGEPSYGPKQLARDMGMSRRTLYMRLASAGTTPARLIARIRLDHAREDILQDRKRSLLDIALANGFQDGASFSRAFRAVFGHPPSQLRRGD